MISTSVGLRHPLFLKQLITARLFGGTEALSVAIAMQRRLSLDTVCRSYGMCKHLLSVACLAEIGPAPILGFK